MREKLILNFHFTENFTKMDKFLSKVDVTEFADFMFKFFQALGATSLIPLLF